MVSPSWGVLYTGASALPDLERQQSSCRHSAIYWSESEKPNMGAAGRPPLGRSVHLCSQGRVRKTGPLRGELVFPLSVHRRLTAKEDVQHCRKGLFDHQVHSPLPYRTAPADRGSLVLGAVGQGHPTVEPLPFCWLWRSSPGFVFT